MLVDPDLDLLVKIGRHDEGFVLETLQGLTAPAGAAILNSMVQYAPVDRTFAALADPTRRVVLERLGSGSATISELARPFGMSLTGMKKHVRVLEEVQLVATVKVGRTRLCNLGPRRLDDIQLWVETYRQMVNEQLDRFGDILDRTKGDRP
jgi:DNA-binding transcriptional ArsR family regulator